MNKVYVPDIDKVRPIDEVKATKKYYDVIIEERGDEPAEEVIKLAESNGKNFADISELFPLQIIDVDHRLFVLRIPDVLSLYKDGLVQAILYTRKNKKRITNPEKLVLGNALNSFSERAIAMSTHDKMRLLL